MADEGLNRVTDTTDSVQLSRYLEQVLVKFRSLEARMSAAEIKESSLDARITVLEAP